MILKSLSDDNDDDTVWQKLLRPKMESLSKSKSPRRILIDRWQLHILIKLFHFSQIFVD